MSLATLDKTHYTTAQAAEKLGKTTGRIRQMARAGVLPGAEVFGTGYLIPRALIDNLKAGKPLAAGTAARKPAARKRPAAKKRPGKPAKRKAR